MFQGKTVYSAVTFVKPSSGEKGTLNLISVRRIMMSMLSRKTFQNWRRVLTAERGFLSRSMPTLELLPCPRLKK